MTRTILYLIAFTLALWVVGWFVPGDSGVALF